MFLAINSIARYEIRSNDRIFAMKPLFYSGTKNASSWAMRAWLALREAGVVFEEEVVDIRRPQRFANLDRIGAFSPPAMVRSEEHTSELQSLMRISYAVFCLKKTTNTNIESIKQIY